LRRLSLSAHGGSAGRGRGDATDDRSRSSGVARSVGAPVGHAGASAAHACRSGHRAIGTHRRTPESMTTMHRTTGATRLAMLAILFGMAGRSAAAQWSGGVGIADSLLAMGRVASAESLYYAASSASPRDPAARAALGRYLAARGALRIGAVLLEEARVFGGDTASLARALVPVYGALGDYRALAALPLSPLSRPERARAEWLVTHAQTLEMEDSVAVVTYR